MLRDSLRGFLAPSTGPRTGRSRATASPKRSPGSGRCSSSRASPASAATRRRWPARARRSRWRTRPRRLPAPLLGAASPNLALAGNRRRRRATALLRGCTPASSCLLELRRGSTRAPAPGQLTWAATSVLGHAALRRRRRGGDAVWLSPSGGGARRASAIAGLGGHATRDPRRSPRRVRRRAAGAEISAGERASGSASCALAECGARQGCCAFARFALLGARAHGAAPSARSRWRSTAPEGRRKQFGQPIGRFQADACASSPTG